MREVLKKSWRGHVESSLGYRIRLAGPTGLEYLDSAGAIRIDSEVMSGPGWEVVVYLDSIPDTPDRPREVVLERIRRAFDFAGWRMTLVTDSGEILGNPNGAEGQGHRS
jgi:hypothetical protein